MNEEQKQQIMNELRAADDAIKNEERKCNGETRRLAHNKAIAYFDGYKQAIKNIIGIMGYKYENGEIITIDNPAMALFGRAYSNENKTLAELLATMSIAQAKEILRTLTDNQREKAISDLIAIYHK